MVRHFENFYRSKLSLEEIRTSCILKSTSSFRFVFGDTFAYVIMMDISRSFVVEIFPNSLQVTREF